MIRTERTIIRPYTEEDLPLVLPIFSDPVTMAFWPQPMSPEGAAAWIERSMRAFAADGTGRMIVTERESGEVIGDCGVIQSQVNGRPEYDLGYIIHHPRWRQGFGLECARASLDYALRTLGLKRIVANMAHDHTGSRRVAEKLGMRREGTFHNPRNRDILTYLYVMDASDAP
jgi:RimJ/RimL family protein N-acetyltransferase